MILNGVQRSANGVNSRRTPNAEHRTQNEKGGPMRPVFILLILCSIALSGCVSAPKKGTTLQTGNFLEPQASFRFSDVPVPTKFKLVPEASYSFEASGMRVGLLKYEGKVDINQVVNFYREQMPMYNWRLLNVIEYGERLMNFDRDQETCIITLMPKGSNVVMTITLGPKSQTSSKKPIK